MEDDGICYSPLGVVTRIQGATMTKSLFICEVLISLPAPLLGVGGGFGAGCYCSQSSFCLSTVTCKPFQTHLAKLFLTFLHYH